MQVFRIQNGGSNSPENEDILNPIVVLSAKMAIWERYGLSWVILSYFVIRGLMSMAIVGSALHYCEHPMIGSPV